MYLRPLFAAAALIALSACSAPQAEPITPAAAPEVTVTATVTATATATATPSAAVVESGLADDETSITAPIITDVNELRMSLMAVGLVCEGWDEIAKGVGGTCKGGIMLNAYPDTELGQRAHRAAVALSFMAISTQDRADVSLLVGPTWFIRADTAGAYMLRDLIGGSVIGIVA